MIKITKKEAEYLVKKCHTPLIVYDEKNILDKINLVKKSFADYKKFKLLYAVKANSNISILKIFKNAGCEIDASSPGDVFLAFKAGFKNKNIYATGPNWTNQELEYFIKSKIFLDLDSISLIKRYGMLNPNSEIGIRINPGIGCGFHKDVYAGGEDSKLGISLADLELANREAEKNNLKIVGLHFHIGSSSFDLKPFISALKTTLESTKFFSDIKYINIGGGYGVDFKKNKNNFDIKQYGKEVIKILNNFNQNRTKDLELRIEMGEFLMWPSACAITRVNTIKSSKNKKFIGVDLNSNHIPTPFLYNTYHHIDTFSKRKKEKVTIAGNLCLAGDILAKERYINGVKEGDLIIIQTVGAYCISRSSNFNSRLRPTEVLRDKKNKFAIIRQEDLSYLLYGQCYEKC